MPRFQGERTRASIVVALLALLTCVSCRSGKPAVPKGGRGPQPFQATDIDVKSLGAPGADMPLLLSPGDALSDADTQAVLARLPAMQVELADTTSFALRERSLPPPRTGRTITQPFPPPPALAGAPGTSSEPLEVLRWSPEGEVGMAPAISITFSQPMIELTSHDAVAANIPVKLTPAAPGKWRWVGTKTLVFEPRGDQAAAAKETGRSDAEAPTERFAAATIYNVEIPAGTKSALGGALAAAKTFTFSTPPLRLQSYGPNYGPTGLEPTLHASFDQQINPADVLATITVDGRKGDLVLLADGEPNPCASYSKGQCVAFKTRTPLPKNKPIKVTVGPGTPSAEGPRKTDKAADWTFNTYGPFEYSSHECYSDCDPGETFHIAFTNSIAADLPTTLVTVSPKIPDQKINFYGSEVSIEGRTLAKTTYTVTVSGELKDDFGQKLGRPKTVTFKVGTRRARMMGPNREFLTLDPEARGKLSLFSVGHPSVKLRLYAVEPTQPNVRIFYQYLERLRGSSNEDLPKEPPGKKVFDGVVPISGKDLVETHLDLNKGLKGGLGHVIAIVRPTLKRDDDDSYDYESFGVWAQSTKLGLTTISDANEMMVLATRLSDGAPVEGVTITADEAPADFKLLTAKDGMARRPLIEGQPSIHWLYAKKGGDVLMMDNSFAFHRPKGDVSWYVFDDRGMYRPGETVRFKGFLRGIENWKGGTLGSLSRIRVTASEVSWTLEDNQGNDIGKGKVKLSKLGAFDGSFKLPGNVHLGRALLRFDLGKLPDGIGGKEYSFSVQIEEFRRPEYEVTAKTSEGPHFSGTSAKLTATANYYAGGPLPNSEVTWLIHNRETQYTPPERGDYAFGRWRPWWWHDDWGSPRRYGKRSYDDDDDSFGLGGYHRGSLGGGGRGGSSTRVMGKTDSSGSNTIEVKLVAGTPALPRSYQASASVMDVNRQAWAASTGFLMHPSDRYVGVKLDKWFVDLGSPISAALIVSDLDGALKSGHEVTVALTRSEWKDVPDEGFQQVEVERHECKWKSAEKPGRCDFKPKVESSYTLRATVLDDKQRPNVTELVVWVGGMKQPPSRELAQEEAQLIPDKLEYQPGDTAELLVMAPFAPAEGIMTVSRSGLLKSERFSMKTLTHKLKVPIEAGHLPNVHVAVELVGSADRVDDEGKPLPKVARRPAFAAASLSLPVPDKARKLEVKATPKEKHVAPGSQTEVAVEVKDWKGAGVAGEVTLIVVDESVLALSSYQTANPLSRFSGSRGSGTDTGNTRYEIMLADPTSVKAKDRKPSPSKMAEMSGAGDNGKMGKGMGSGGRSISSAGPRGGAGGQISVRADFDPLALFVGVVDTDASGKVTVKVKVPDNLTRYRVMAIVAAGESAFGTGESTITARLPMMVRPSAPRFLNFGDRMQLPIVVQNQTDQPIEADVALRAANAVLIGGGDQAVMHLGRRVKVPANDRVELRFPVAAALAGTARFQVGAVSGKFVDAAEISLPVWTPATTEAMATYGTMDGTETIAQPVKAPPNVFPQFGGLEITTSSTELQALTDAVLYLQSYPFECAEQVSSRVLAVASLRDVLAAFKTEGLPPPAEILAAVARDMKKLQSLQGYDGGWGFWNKHETWPFVSIHVTHAIVRAKQKKFDVPADMLDNALDYLGDIESKFLSHYSAETKRALRAYALYVLHHAGKPNLKKARALFAELPVDKHQLETLGWLWPTLVVGNAETELVALRRHVQNRAVEEAGTAHFVTSFDDSGAYLLLASDRRLDGLFLEGMINDLGMAGVKDLIPKVVKGLMAHKKRGHWGSTQENAWVLLGLDRYFNVFEKDVPDFVTRAWLGEHYAGEQTFKGRSIDRQHVEVPMAFLARSEAAQKLILAKEGAGRMYYRLGVKYAPKDLAPKPAEHGFTVVRIYEAVDDPKDVTRDAGGVWHVRAGARVRVRISMVAPTRRYHVALVDPLPAGLEIMNPALAVTGPVPVASSGSDRYWWWWSTWYEHQNLRDERAEAFTSLLWEGVHKYEYVARATTPGSFVVPPAKAEEMYEPETFGRSAGDRVVVE